MKNEVFAIAQIKTFSYNIELQATVSLQQGQCMRLTIMQSIQIINFMWSKIDWYTKKLIEQWHTHPSTSFTTLYPPKT